MTRGRGIVSAAMGASGVFAVTQIAATVHPEGAVLAAAVLVSLVLFAGGSLVFVAGFLKAVGRSRDESIDLAGLVWLAGAAPANVSRKLRGAVLGQSAIAVATASIRPYTAVAFGILAPVCAMGLLTLWAAYHGDFRAIGQKPAAMSDAGDDVPPGDPTPSDAGDPDDFDQLFKRRKRRSS